MRSSMRTSDASLMISVRRGVEYSFAISTSSPRMIAITFSLWSRIDCSSSMRRQSSSYSSCSLSRSSPVRRARRMSRMASACSALNCTGAADQRDDLVDDVEGLEQAVDDVRARRRLVETEARAAADHVDAVVAELLE